MGKVDAGLVHVFPDITTVRRIREYTFDKWRGSVGLSTVPPGNSVNWGNTTNQSFGEGIVTSVDRIGFTDNGTVSFYVYSGVPPRPPPKFIKRDSGGGNGVNIVRETINSADWANSLMPAKKRVIQFEGESVVYNIASVPTQDVIELATPYVGPSTGGAIAYKIGVDYTPAGLPLIALGDIDAPELLSRAFSKMNRLAVTVINGFTASSVTQTSVPWGAATPITFDLLGDWNVPDGVIYRPTDSKFQIDKSCWLRMNVAVDMNNTGRSEFIGNAQLSIDVNSQIKKYLGSADGGSQNGLTQALITLQTPLTRFNAGDTFSATVTATTTSGDASYEIAASNQTFIEIEFIAYS